MIFRSIAANVLVCACLAGCAEFPPRVPGAWSGTDVQRFLEALLASDYSFMTPNELAAITVHGPTGWPPQLSWWMKSRRDGTVISKTYESRRSPGFLVAFHFEPDVDLREVPPRRQETFVLSGLDFFTRVISAAEGAAVIQAWMQPLLALAKEPPIEEALVETSDGWQFCSREWRIKIKTPGTVDPLVARSQCFDTRVDHIIRLQIELPYQAPTYD